MIQLNPFAVLWSIPEMLLHLYEKDFYLKYVEIILDPPG